MISSVRRGHAGISMVVARGLVARKSDHPNMSSRMARSKRRDADDSGDDVLAAIPDCVGTAGLVVSAAEGVVVVVAPAIVVS